MTLLSLCPPNSFVFYAVHVVSKESTQLVLPRTSCQYYGSMQVKMSTSDQNIADSKFCIHIMLLPCEPPVPHVSFRFNCQDSIRDLSPHMRWVSCHHGMARPQVADGGDGRQILRVAANLLNKQSRTADKGCSSSLGVGRGFDDSSH
jgi:hypothetical protein